MEIQTRLIETGDYAAGKANVRFTKHFPREHRNGIMEKMRMVVEHFPEYWERTIIVGLEGDMTLYGGHFVSIDDHEIRIRLVKDADLWLIAHELTHGIQYISNIPTGEKSCDLYCLARCYDYATHAPTYLDFPEEVRDNWYDWIEVAHFIAKDAIERRDKGLRNYIKFFEDKLTEMVKESVAK